MRLIFDESLDTLRNFTTKRERIRRSIGKRPSIPHELMIVVIKRLHKLRKRTRHVELGGRHGGLDSEEFRELNPVGKVSVLVDNGNSIWESHTTLRYLAATYGERNWFSSDPYSRSPADRWLDWAQVIFQFAFMAVFWGYYRTPVEKRNMPLIESKLLKCHECLQILDDQLSENEFLIGSVISLADIPAGAVLYRLTKMDLDVALPSNVDRWYKTLCERSAYQR
jgi:glutathione S-transferase